MKRVAPRGERGQAVVILALALSGMVMSIGLVVDAGTLYSSRRTAQAGADAAAWAGAVVLYKGASPAEVRSAAVLDASRNGYLNGGNTTLTVSTPPTEGPFAGDPAYVEVVIRQEVGTRFLPGLNSGLTTVQVRAVGGAAPFTTGHAILALDPDAPQAFKTNGNGNVSAYGGGVMVNSSSAQAVHVNGNGSVLAPYTNVVGGVELVGRGVIDPAPTTGANIAPDPFRGLPPPDSAGLPVFVNTRVTRTEVLQPGIYQGGITVTANGDARFAPGTYILKGGGLQVSGNGELHMESATDGVLFYNTHDSFPGDPGTCGDVKVVGNGEVELRGPASGLYAGILFYQDRACTLDLMINGNGSLTSLTGTIYAPTAPVKIAGNGTADLAFTAQIVASTVQWAGNGNLQITYNAGLLGRPILPTLAQ